MITPAGSPARLAAFLIAVFSLGATLLSWSAARHTSATFDETVLVAGGVRGVELGEWGMVTDQPPLPMYVYGAVARGAVDSLPAEGPSGFAFEDRWRYARALFFQSGNDTDALLGRARLVAVLTAGLLVAAAGAFAWWAAGPLAGGLAAVLTLLTPDVLAHGGVAYNDLPLALAFLVAVWALDAAIRRPTPVRGCLAGAATGAALCVKLSAVALAPVAAGLLAAEAWVRRPGGEGMRDGPSEPGPNWWRRMAVVAGVGLLAGYVAMVMLYRGDPTLTLFRFNFYRTVFHASEGHIAPAFLMGRTSATGFWYFFPVAAFFKTPVAFQLLISMALGLGVRRVRRDPARVGAAADLLAWKGRGAVLGAMVFGAFLMRSSLNAGFRYALPVLPLLAVAAAVVLAKYARQPLLRWTVAVFLVLQAASTLSAYPHFLAYTSVWAGGRDDGHEVLVDSSLDWGQGLRALRDFMAEEGVDRVALSYFGSAPPEAYGIRYEALPSFFRLEGGVAPDPDGPPRFTVVSATNLQGIYLQGRDPFAAYRGVEPYRVLAHSLFVFEGQ